MTRPFLKMNGAGNDFVVVGAGRSSDHPAFAPAADIARAIADRQTGVGCDQLIGLDASRSGDVLMRIWNADGGEVEACGNATRCVGWLLMEASGRPEAVIETKAGLVRASRAGPHAVTVDMGEPRLDWRDIPLAEDMDTARVELQVGPIDAPLLHTPGCVSMGNPHVVFFVDEVDTETVIRVGSLIEHHPLFPEGVNVGFAQVLSSDRIRLRVWERGAGLTKACGTGACAALVAAHRRGLAGRKAVMELDGGELTVEWRESDGHVLMTGPVEVEFSGVLPERLS
ncbi:MAG TPA: diaminopimelate epimerase [Caulobacteraceae bacterium]|jgi:diaminopimelate epimerase|nr:diaminopimelate epimerase [Caulobacteraceae bacterium]